MNWREIIGKRAFRYGTGAVSAALLVLGILVFLALLAERFAWRLDVTPDQSQSLTQVSRLLLKEVEHPLTMTVFYPEIQEGRQKVKEILETYVYHNRQISYRFVDPAMAPSEAKEAGYRYPGNILLEYQGRRQMANVPDEETVTQALRRVLKPQRKKVYFLTGHGERSLENPQRGGYQVAKRALENEGYEVAPLNLLQLPEEAQKAEVPQDAALVVVAAPSKSLTPPEIEALKAYLQQGGRLLVLLEPHQDGGLKEFLAAYGVELDDAIILDRPRTLVDVAQQGRVMGTSPDMILVEQYGDHRITEEFANLATIYPQARPLILPHGGVKGVGGRLALATTSATSFAKLGKDWLKERKFTFNPDRDRKGPLTLAVLVEIKADAPPAPEAEPQEKSPPEKASPEPRRGYLVVFGDSDFADNIYFNLLGNGDLFLNTVNFLAEEEKQILVRAQERKSQPLTLTEFTAWGLLILSLVLMPGTMLFLGVRSYLKRRRARR